MDVTRNMSIENNKPILKSITIGLNVNEADKLLDELKDTDKQEELLDDLIFRLNGQLQYK